MDKWIILTMVTNQLLLGSGIILLQYYGSDESAWFNPFPFFGSLLDSLWLSGIWIPDLGTGKVMGELFGPTKVANLRISVY